MNTRGFSLNIKLCEYYFCQKVYKMCSKKIHLQIYIIDQILKITLINQLFFVPELKFLYSLLLTSLEIRF